MEQRDVRTGATFGRPFGPGWGAAGKFPSDRVHCIILLAMGNLVIHNIGQEVDGEAWRL
jgi:hypothetical protein